MPDASYLDDIAVDAIGGVYHGERPDEKVTPNLDLDPSQPRYQPPTQKRFVPPGGELADETTGLPVGDRFAMGLAGTQTGKMSYLRKQFGDNNVWVDYQQGGDDALYVRDWVPVWESLALSLNDAGIPVRSGPDGPEAFRWIRTNVKGADLGDVAESGPDILQAGIAGAAGLASANTVVAGGVDAGLEALRKGAAIGVGADDQQSPAQIAGDIIGSGITGGLMQGGANLLARGAQQVRPRNIIGRIVRDETEAASRNIDLPTDFTKSYSVESGRMRANPDQPIVKQVRDGVSSVANTALDAARSVGDAAMGRGGGASLLNEGELLADVGSEFGRRENLIRKFNIDSASVGQRTGSPLLEGLEDVARSTPSAQARMKAQQMRVGREFNQAFERAINAKDPTEYARIFNRGRVQYRRRVLRRESEFNKEAQKRFSALHKQLEGRKIFEYKATRALTDDLISELEDASTGPRRRMLETVQRLRANLDGDPVGIIDRPIGSRQLVLQERRVKAATSRQIQNILREFGQVIDDPSLFTGSAVISPDAIEKAKAIYSALLTDLGDASVREPSLVREFQDMRRWFGKEHRAIDREKKSTVAKVLGVFSTRGKPGEKLPKIMLQQDPSVIRSTMQAIRDIDPQAALDMRAATLSQMFKSAEYTTQENVLMRSMQKISTIAGKERVRLDALFAGDSQGLKEMRQIAELARILVTPPMGSRTAVRLSANELVGLLATTLSGKFRDAGETLVHAAMSDRLARLLTDPDLRKTLLRVAGFPKKSAAALRTIGEVSRTTLLSKIGAALDDYGEIDRAGETGGERNQKVADDALRDAYDQGAD
jgi:hypothetical protein